MQFSPEIDQVRIRCGYAPLGDVTLYYEDMGDLEAPVIILVMGLGAQLSVWSVLLCQDLIAKGFRVIRFDNRDVGLSSKFEHAATSPIVSAAIKSRLGIDVKAPYDLFDMVQDLVGLMDYLSVRACHLVGASMGGMISQITSALHPERVLSLVSIMSSTNEASLPNPKMAVLKSMVGNKPAVHQEDAVNNFLKFWQTIKSPKFETPPSYVADRIRYCFQRSSYALATKHHTLAILATGGFSYLLNAVSAPTLILHGDVDPLVRFEGGIASAKAIKSAHLEKISGLGHELPPLFDLELSNYISSHANAVSA